ncbi:SecY protein transport family protein [Actinidia rufa]|uniref:SecY protein transport family protein n=1 Tax=Actinidia rufa TaxID=165716 RepID=A0A7J0FJB2_9ERIC|nr:SecY protein transport family protein [Actinidia rufa]
MKLGDFSEELKLSLFQLGISPQIAASILMQVLCHVVPSLVKLRKEGLDAQEKIKSYMVKHVMVTSFLLVCGAMTMTWICDNITESGFGSAAYWLPYILAVLGIFTVVTMSAVVITEGCRKIKLQYYGFKLASAASVLGSSFWEHVREILNPDSSLGAKPWVYYSIYAFFVFVFNIFDIANMPKEIADYLNKIGARIPNIKPGKATIEYLTKIQASTRFWGGLLLSFLATTSSILDHYLRHINEGFAIGFTSVLIIRYWTPWLFGFSQVGFRVLGLGMTSSLWVLASLPLCLSFESGSDLLDDSRSHQILYNGYTPLKSELLLESSPPEGQLSLTVFLSMTDHAPRKT